MAQIERRSDKPHTYLPEEGTQQELRDFARGMRDLKRFLHDHVGDGAALVDAQGNRRLIPAEVFRALEQVANALAAGDGVLVAPTAMRLTTQEAADFLRISRPTLVKLLEQNELPYEMVGRHRRVTLRDVLDYQERSQARRGGALTELAQMNAREELLEQAPVPVLRGSERAE